MKINNYKDVKFVTREVHTHILKGGEYIPEKRYIIGITTEGVIIPHPVTDFIDKKYYLSSGSINSEKAVGNVVVQFLNYILKQVMEKTDEFLTVKGIADLELKHLEHYLEFCTTIGNSRKTVEKKEYYLLNFFYFFGHEKQILKQTPSIKRTLQPRLQRNSKLLNANLYYKMPPKYNDSLSPIKKKDLVTQQWVNLNEKRKIRLMLIKELLMLAQTQFPEIAFAVALQIFGGLRSAECMNLTIGAIKPQGNDLYGEDGLIVEIRDRQNELFIMMSSTLNNDQVKKPRDQSILLNQLVPYLYKKHIEWLNKKQNKLKRKSKFLETNALFINSLGAPMRTHTYRAKFNQLKSIYLGVLKSTAGRYEDFKELRETKWSTHIGRGTFTNLCLDAGFTPTQTAIMRGDNSPQAMYDYFDILTSSAKISQAIDLSPDQLINLTSEENNMGGNGGDKLPWRR